MKNRIEEIKQEITQIEYELMCQENMTYLPEGFYDNKDKLHELKKELKSLGGAVEEVKTIDMDWDDYVRQETERALAMSNSLFGGL